MRNPIEMVLFNDEYKIKKEFELKNIKDQKLAFIIVNEFGKLDTISFEEKEVIIENRNKEDLSMKFKGLIEKVDYLNRTQTQVNFIIIPDYVCFTSRNP